MKTRSKTDNNIWKRGIFIVIIALLIITIIGTTIYAYKILNKETFYNGIYVDGIKLDNTSKKGALNIIVLKNQPNLDKMVIVLKHENQSWEFDYNHINGQVNAEEIIDKAYSLGREGNIIERLKEIYRVSKEFKRFETTLTYDVSLINGDIKNIAKEIHVEPIDASIDFQPNKKEKFKYTPEKMGREMHIEKTIEEIKDRVNSDDFTIYEISTEELHPKYTLDQVKTWNSRIAYYSTPLNNVANRNHNIKLSSEAYYNVRVDPGEEYSMNEATGPRGIAEGYRDASVIKQGKKFEPEPGGGNCQTSTTLYGAVMRADLDVLNRLPHSIKSTYTDLGTDAMVDYPWADFKFKNNKDTPIFITRYISGGKLHVEIYGKSPSEYDEIKIISEKISESELPPYKIIEDPNLLEGKETIDWRSRSEIKAVSYKVYYKNGREIKRIKEAHSTYPGVIGQKTVGTKKKPIEPPIEAISTEETPPEEVLIEEIPIENDEDN